MAVGKRHDKNAPLTEHDVAERIDKAAVRLVNILMSARQDCGEDFMAEVKGSRYLTNILSLLREELDTWGIEPPRERPGKWADVAIGVGD